MPARIANSSGTIVCVGAAAWASVSPGRKTGSWASANPMISPATAIAADARAASKRRASTSASVPMPPSAERIAPTRPGPLTRRV